MVRPHQLKTKLGIHRKAYLGGEGEGGSKPVRIVEFLFCVDPARLVYFRLGRGLSHCVHFRVGGDLSHCEPFHPSDESSQYEAGPKRISIRVCRHLVNTRSLDQNAQDPSVGSVQGSRHFHWGSRDRNLCEVQLVPLPEEAIGPFTFERIRHTEDSQGQILAMSFK